MVTAHTLETKQEAILMERSDKPPLSKGGLEGLSKCKQLNSHAIPTQTKKTATSTGSGYTFAKLQK